MNEPGNGTVQKGVDSVNTSACSELMAELQQLPVSGSALRRRLLALDRAVAGHVAVIMQAASMELPGVNCASVTIWVAESSR